MSEAKVKILIVCTNSGRSFGKDIVQKGSQYHLLDSSSGYQGCVQQLLINVTGKPAINHTLQSIKNCQRICDLREEVYIVCNNINYGSLVVWAQNSANANCTLKAQQSNGLEKQQNARQTGDNKAFNVEHILNVGERFGNPVQDIIQAVQHFKLENDLMIVMGNYIFGPNFNFQRILEHSIVRNDDTLTFIQDPSPNFGLNHGYQVTIDQENSPIPKIVKVDVDEVNQTSSKNQNVLTPLMFLQNSTINKLIEWNCTNQPKDYGFRQLAKFLQYLVTQKLVYGLRLDCIFSLRSLLGYQFTKGFYDYYQMILQQKIQSIKLNGIDSHIVLDEDMKNNGLTSVQKRELLAQITEVDGNNNHSLSQKALRYFNIDIKQSVEQFIQQYSTFQDHRYGADEKQVPERFANAYSWKHQTKQQHPVFTTTNNLYGIYAPQQADMPVTWYGRQGEFIKRNVNYKWQGLNTSKNRSKVHRQLEEF